jgi:thiamine kinase-like enzyme
MDNVIGILVMKDFKGETLEYNPQFDDFVEAAKTLSKIRNNARSAIKKGKLTNEKYLTHYVSKDNVTNDLMYLSQQDKYVDSAKKTFLNKALDVLPYHVSQLYKNFPLTLTHNDYHLKNLLRINEGIAVIDWASAYLSPHLGDLYCLIHEAKNYNISPADLIYAYSEEMDDSLSNDIEWQINMGGICWTIHVLRQLFDYGIEAIPVAREWVPELISDIHILMDDL